jgi:selenocysteine lyase/cysteine desulfurase
MQKTDFTPPPGPYFLSHSVGLSPRAARATLDAAYFEPWAAGDGATWTRWLAASDVWRQSLAPLIGADADDICPQTNISSALTKILSALPIPKGRTKIVLCEEDFPTVGFVMAQARRVGLEPIFLKSGPELADPGAWERAFRDDVFIAHVTHVFSNLGLKAPVGEIVARARAKGVVTIVDAAQSAGAVEIDAAHWNADFITGTSVKYLCGGNGAGFLWVNPEIAPKCAPADVGWFSHENPFEFDIRRFAYANAAARFWGGTPSIAPFAIASAGLDLIARAGVANVARHNQRLFDKVAAALPASAFLSHVKAGERGCSFIIAPRDPGGARAALAEAKIAHDERAGGLRFSVHLYNDDADVEALVGVLARFL